MEFRDLQKEVIYDIMSTEEGKQELIDYANGRMSDARKILNEYRDKLQQKMGTRIDLSDRYLEDNAIILIRKLVPNVYDNWKNGRRCSKIKCCR